MQKMYLSLLLLLSSLMGTSALRADTEAQLRVGMALPLTGTAIDYGNAYRRGLELFLVDHPQKAQQLQFFYEDHQYDNKITVSAVRKLSDVDKARVIVVWGFTPSDTVAPLSNEIAAPLLLSSTNPIAKDRKWVFNLTSPLDHLLRTLALNLTERKIRSIGYVTTDVGVLEQSVKVLNAQLGPDVKMTIHESVPSDSTDFRSLIARLRETKLDALGLMLLPSQVRAFLRQARAVKYFVPAFGGNTFSDPLVTEVLHDDLFHAVLTDWYVDPQFIEREKAAGRPLNHIAEVAQGYVLGMILADIAANAGPTFEPQQIVNVMNHLKDSKSPAGTYEVRKNPERGWHLLFPVELSRARDGKIEHGVIVQPGAATPLSK